MLEIEDLIAFDSWITRGMDREPAAIQGLDLRDYDDVLLREPFMGSLFLGCDMSLEVAGHLVRDGATVIMDDPTRLFHVHRARLYSVDELFDGFDVEDPRGYFKSFDRRVYDRFMDEGGAHPASIATSLARRLHDHSMTDALEEIIEGQRVVAIMGGHGMERSDPFYAQVAEIARRLTELGYLMVSGGGPGAMEATHLGAYFANLSREALAQAIAALSPRPSGAKPGKEYADPDWLHRAWRVRDRWPIGDTPRYHSVAIPTWHYGHEPPAPFATHFAKYFANSVREEGLLAIANHGVIFAPGAAGTLQEVFQDAAQNHYESFGPAAPMVLLGAGHWTTKVPAWQLLNHVARGRRYADLLTLTDLASEAIAAIEGYTPS